MSKISEEIIIRKIYIIRGVKVMLDRDLSELYGVETKVLKQAVKRNIIRFPDDFMFEMNNIELENWRKEHSDKAEDKMGLRYAPFCFTEQGVTMLACILHSERAIQMNIKIIRIFTKLREMLLTHKDILLKLEHLEKQTIDNNAQIKVIFDALRSLLNPLKDPIRQIGFKQNGRK